MNKLQDEINAAWKKSRHGAWAGRGFHYQHLVSCYTLVRQWAGLAPAAYLVPEGLEDCVLELTDCEIWVQIKSRKNGAFPAARVTQILSSLDSKAAALKHHTEPRTALVLEQPPADAKCGDIEALFASRTGTVLVCEAPGDETVRLLTSELDVAAVIAEGIVSDLYRLVADASQENASLPFAERRRISTTEVERRIFERLEADDPSAIDGALISGAAEPVDFKTAVAEPGFYHGVKVRPGHVAAGLVIERPDDTKRVIALLKRRRHVLVAAPSGAGKSALVWLAASELAGAFRWFQITGVATAADADALIRFVRARRPTETSPIALTFDEVGPGNAALWDMLVREFGGLPAVHLLGSVRQEDVALIASRSATEFFPITLNDKLAETVWQKLAAGHETAWPHWREPFERSEGLMLEYVHLLTSGQRLFTVIEEQVQQRERDGRDDELAIIRSTAVLCSRGGEVDAGRLITTLGLKPEAASRALKRLIDEHLVRESRPGVLGGLHLLRSDALRRASHDEVLFLSEESLWRCLAAATKETLPRVVQSILAETREEQESDTLRRIADILAASADTELWTAVLTGLALGTLERCAASLVALLEEHRVQRAQWSLASMFSDPGTDVPDLPQSKPLQRLRRAVSAFRAAPKQDLRRACLALLPAGTEAPAPADLQQANRFLSSITPIWGSDPLQVPLALDLRGEEAHDIRQIAALLSTAYLIGREVAENFVEQLGGEEALFAQFHTQTPWVTAPEIEEAGRHGRTVRANWYYAAELYQPDPHETVCDICETLIAISPASDAAACDAVDPLGQPMVIAGGIAPWSNNMPRGNIPARARVAWNVAFRQILLARTGADSLTDYAIAMAALVRRTEKVFRSFTERWIKGNRPADAEALAAEINAIIDEVNALAYAAPDQTKSGDGRSTDGGTIDDTLGALLTGVLGNLVRMLNKMPGDGAKAAASFAGSLAARAEDYQHSAIWRAVFSPPLSELEALRSRLANIAAILHEMAHDGFRQRIDRIVKAAKAGSLGKAVRAAARHCSALADRRFEDRLRELERALAEQGIAAQCYWRPGDQSDSIHWPDREIAILISIVDFETDARRLADGLAIGQQHLGTDWPFRVVPVMNGKVMAPLALLSSSSSPLPDLRFAEEWPAHIELPFALPLVPEPFDAAVSACMQVSAVIACRDLEKLHPREEEAIASAVDAFRRNFALVAEAAAERTASETFAWAAAYLEEMWAQIANELEAKQAGQPVGDPLCMASHLALAGEESEHANGLAVARMLLLQAECRNLAAAGAGGPSRPHSPADHGRPPVPQE